MSRINVFTEWGKLKEVIVGSVINTSERNVDLSFKLFYHANIKDLFLKKSYSLQKKLIEQREEDLVSISSKLKSLGVKVLRPKPLDKVQQVKTPHFEDHTKPYDNPRDLILIVGDKIIETPVLCRHRYFENDQVKSILMNYFKDGANWICAPRPTLKQTSFDFSYVKKDSRDSDWDAYNNNSEDFEIMFDAAQCLKFGKDIVMNISTENHRLGAIWLERLLGSDYNIHQVKITDHHIDGMFMPLAPGKLLINPYSMSGKIHLLPKQLQKWDMIRYKEEEEFRHYSDEEILLASNNISVNVLPLNEKQVMVFSEKEEGPSDLMKSLERNKIEPIPVRLRHSRLFDGGLHCTTLDTVREDKLEDFFN